MVESYFEWLSGLAIHNEYSRKTYRKLLTQLYDTEFRYLIPRDKNRANDGCDLRWRYTSTYADNNVPDGPCSILEMMVALAVRCEETIMDDPSYGDRTQQWFWGMVTSLGLARMTNDNYDEKEVNDILTRFINREYDPDGRGGLFTIRNCNHDLRTAEIWYQFCWFLDSIT